MYAPGVVDIVGFITNSYEFFSTKLGILNIATLIGSFSSSLAVGIVIVLLSVYIMFMLLKLEVK